MNNKFFPNFWRFIGLVAVQVLLLKQMTVSLGAYFNILLYPLFIFLLPTQLATPYVVLLGFGVGLTVDFFYASIGVHASAGAFSGFFRFLLFAAFAPKGGYSGKEPIFSPAHMGWSLYLQVSAWFFLAHLFWYFSVDDFTIVYFGTVTLKTIAGWVLTMIFVWLYTAMFNPKN
jgi:hypothetical protein